MPEGREVHGDEDARLLGAYARGEAEALARLFDRHYDRVYRLAYRYTGSAADAEDLAQNVFLKVMRAAAEFEPRARFTTWLFRITVNECLSHIRRHRRNPEVGTEADLAETPGPDQPNPVEAVQRDELRRQVRRAVLSLPERQRLAVVLSRYEGLSYAEIAEVLGTSPQAVKSLLARAHASLREKLQRYLDRQERSGT